MIETLRQNYNYDPLTGLFTWIKKGKKFGTPAFTTLDVYYQARVKGKKVYAHRAAFVLMGEDLPPMVDHEDRNKLNNKWANLKWANASLNSLNRDVRPDNTTGYTGVMLHKCGKFQANLFGEYLGLFDTAEQARDARNAKIYG